ncbi:hypothetical protein EHS25_001846 [Saitozyma podzolica]|uniref:Uncharacterized protein n=1 Tax=Saitozyma podzolica TaxID=1890683 RepID=A0A427YFL9_9TREE|nr:hypothetical protein EHS25_001846 [Saitozyma podzolica]
MSDNNLGKIFTDIPKLTGKRTSQFIEPNASPSEGSQSAWRKRDGQLAGLILQSTATPILSAHLHLVIPSLEISSPSAEKDSPPHIGRASTVYHALKKTYGTSNGQYTFALGRRFIDNRVHGDDSVGNWVNEVKAQHRGLKSLSFDLDALCVNVLLNGLPDRFSSYVDNVWTNSETPTIDSVSDSYSSHRCWSSEP